MPAALSFTPSQTLRVRLAALWMGVLTAAYAALTAGYFWADVLQFAGPDRALAIDSSGLAVHMEGNLWTVLSPWRVLLAMTTAVLLGGAAVALWNRMPRARILSIVALWGLVLPQVFWATEFLLDWHDGNYLMVPVVAGFAAVAVPTALLFGRSLVRRFEGTDTLTGWANLTYGRARLVGSAIALSWVGYAGTQFMDQSYRLDSNLAWAGAFMAVIFGGLAVAGILRLRAWALWSGVIAALSLSLVPLAAIWTPYQENVGYHLDWFASTLANSPIKLVFWILLPLVVVWVFAGPFLRDFVKKLREQEAEQ
jgi:hypothetical protein